MQDVLHRSPVLFGLDRHTWTLKTLGQTIAWMRSLTQAAVCKLLKRFKVVYKRGRAHVHSPDLEYNQKLAPLLDLPVELLLPTHGDPVTKDALESLKGALS